MSLNSSIANSNITPDFRSHQSDQDQSVEFRNRSGMSLNVVIQEAHLEEIEEMDISENEEDSVSHKSSQYEMPQKVGPSIEQTTFFQDVIIDHLDTGLAIFNFSEQDSVTSAKLGFKFSWCNDVFENLFECHQRIENLKLKIFRDYSIVGNTMQRDWSLTDLMVEVHSKFK